MKKIPLILTALFLLFPAYASASADAPSAADIYIFGDGIALNDFPVFENGVLFVPAKEFFAHAGANDISIDAENQITATYGEKYAVMHIGSCDAIQNGDVVKLSEAPFFVGETLYLPAEFLANALGFTVNTAENGGIYSIYIDLPVTYNAAEEYINSAGIASDTPYLIWVNKGEYTVYTFLHENGHWKQVYACPCAIGANATPTITGTYKYYSREKRWSYDDFYVGPIMRFYGGYAIHSTLLKYDGTAYNAAVGKKLSHGCVRVRPADINWMVCYVPLKTTVHITEH